jgi:hypothetical protein
MDSINVDQDMDTNMDALDTEQVAAAPLDPSQPEIRFMQKKVKRETSARLPARYLQEQPVLDTFEAALNPQVNQTQKKSQKLKKKLAKREQKRDTGLPEGDVDMGEGVGVGGSSRRAGYDFAEHFGALPDASDSE